MKCCTGLWILGLATYQKIFFLHKSIAIYLKGFTNSDLDHKGNHHTLWPFRIKGHGGDKHLSSVHCHLREETKVSYSRHRGRFTVQRIQEVSWLGCTSNRT